MDDTSRGWGLLLGHQRGPHLATSGDFATAMDTGAMKTLSQLHGNSVVFDDSNLISTAGLAGATSRVRVVRA